MAKEAFCLVLWRASGGLVDPEGIPTGPAVEGLCKKPEDCATCKLMQRELDAREPGTTYLWVCPDCIDHALAGSKHWGISTSVPGYYTSGICQRPQCARRTNGHPEAGYSNFLQLLVIKGDRVP